jgi:eukaryotic-like serine/threonine-protein kinase
MPINFFKRPTIPPFSFPHQEEREVPLPDRIGPYKIQALLEKGGMSLLYLATDPKSEAPLIVKVLSPRFLSHPEMTNRFLKEAEIIAIADHPNIVKLLGYGSWEGGLYIAMEFVKGISLRQYLLQTPLSLKKSLELILEIAYALCHLHTHGVIHRDLKPENILVDEKGQIKVIDFGIAQLIDPLEIEKSHENWGKKRLIGTPIYMSPEQRENPENVSYPSDIYSLGIVAYELILGKFPGGQVRLSLMPKGFQKVLSKALQPNITERYIDIVDFISDLSSYAHSPEFEKEKKTSDQAIELYEKLQSVQLKMIPDTFPKLSEIDLGIVIHRPLGISGTIIDFNKEHSFLVLGESSCLEIDSLLQSIYIKGLLDGFFPFQLPFEELAKQMNQALFASPTNFPLTLGFLGWDLKQKTISYLSCGSGPVWKISDSGIHSETNSNIALGIDPHFSFQSQILSANKGDKFVLCPLSGTGNPFTLPQFSQLLEENKSLQPQGLAEAIYRKAKALGLKYFDEHPFVVVVLGISP